MGNIAATFNPFKNVQLDLEYAGSLWDKNRLSSLDDGNNFGSAANLFLKVIPSNVDIGSLSLGKIGFSYHERFIDKRFTSTDRFNVVEFDRIYNTAGSSQSEGEQFREGKLNLIPIEEMNLIGTIASLKRGDTFQSNRYNGLLTLSNRKNYSLKYDLDYVGTENINIGTKWWRQSGDANYILWELLKPGFSLFIRKQKTK